MAIEFDYDRQLAFSKAHLGESSATGLNDDGTITIAHDVPLGAGDGAREWLQTNRKTVEDEVVDFSPLEGIWRSVKIETEKSTTDVREVRVLQTFAQGWITSLVDLGAVDWDEARLVQSTEIEAEETSGTYPEGLTAPENHATNPQEYHLVRWEGIDPTKIEEIAASIRAISSTGWSPVVNGEAIGTGFFRLKVIDSIDRANNNLDKSGTIDVLLAKPRFDMQTWENYGTPAATVQYHLYRVPSHIAQALSDAFNERTGASCRLGKPDDNGLIDIEITDSPEEDTDDDMVSGTSCSFYTTTSFYHNVSAPVDVPENSMGITYRARFALDRRTGLYAGSIEKRQRETQHIAAYRGDNTHANYTEVERWEGAYLIDGDYKVATLSISGGAVETSLSSAITLPTNDIDAGDTWRVEKSVNEDCTYDLVVRERTEKAISDLAYDTADSNVASSSATEQLNETTGSVTLTAGTNETLRATVRYNKETALYDIVEDTTVSKPTEGSDIEVTAAATKTVTRDIQTATKPTDPTQEDGKLKSTQWRETEFAGRYEATESVVEAIDQDAASGSVRADQTSAVTTSTQQAAQEAVAGDAGVITNIQNRPTDFGAFAVSKEVITPIDQSGGGEEVRADRTSETVTATQSATDADATPVAGKVVQTQNRPTEFGKIATQRTLITPLAQTTTHDSASRADQTSERTIATNAAAAQDATPVAGKIVNASSKENEFAKFDNTLETITPLAQTTTHESSSRADQTADRVVSTNAAAKQDATAVAGKVVNASSKENEFGKFDNTLDTITPVDQAGEGTEARADRTSATVTATQSDTVADDEAVDGKIIQAQSRPTEFGKYATTKTVITPVDQTNSAYQESSAESLVEEGHTQADSVLAQPTVTVGEIRDISNVETEFGKVKTTDRTRTATDQEADSVESRADKTSATTTHTQAAEEASGTPIAGQIIQTKNSPTNFGKYATQKTTITPVDQTGTAEGVSSSESYEETIHTQAAVELSTPVETEGEIIDRSSVPTEFGLYKTTDRTRTAKDQEGQGASVRADRTSDTETHTQADAAAVETAVAGSIVNAQSRPTDFGKWNTSRELITPINQVNTTESESSAASMAQDINTHAAANIDAPSTIAGEVNEVVNRQTEFGTVETTARTTTAKDQESTDDAKSLYVETSTEKHTQAAEPTPAAFVAGTVKSVASAPTEFGLFRTAEQTQTAQAISDTDKVTTADYFTAQVTSKDRNQVAAGADITTLDGAVINTSRWTRNEFARYDNEDTSLTPTARDSGWIEYVDENGASYYRGFRNQAAPLVDGYTDFTNNSLSFSMNKHGLYDGSGSRIAKAATDSGSIFRSTRTDARTEAKYRRIEKVSAGAGKYYENQSGTDTRTHKSVITNNYGDADLAYSSYFEDLANAILVKGPTLTSGKTFDGYSYYRVDATYLLDNDDWA